MTKSGELYNASHINEVAHDDLTDSERTYYEYHGWHDEGINVADNVLPFGFSEVAIA